MKTSRIGLLVVAIALASGCKSMKFTKVDAVDGTQQAAAEKFGRETLTAWAQEKYPKVEVPADPKFKEGQDDEGRQKAAAKSIEAQLGKFESMAFVEANRSDPPKFVVYRFKGRFAKSDSPAEVRVVYDLEGRLGGFWIKPWKDNL